VPLALDDSAPHESEAIMDRQPGRPRFHVHSAPTSASWTDRVERWFGLPTRRALRRGVRRPVADLERDVRALIDATGADPRPLPRVRSADDILASVRRVCRPVVKGHDGPEGSLRTSEPGH
jgi:hypothetical protein